MLTSCNIIKLTTLTVAHIATWKLIIINTNKQLAAVCGFPVRLKYTSTFGICSSATIDGAVHTNQFCVIKTFFSLINHLYNIFNDSCKLLAFINTIRCFNPNNYFLLLYNYLGTANGSPDKIWWLGYDVFILSVGQLSIFIQICFFKDLHRQK